MKEIIKLPQNEHEKTKAILVMVLGFGFLGFIFRERSESLSGYLYLVAFSIGVLALLSAFLRDKIIWLWYALASVMGMVMSKLLLGLFFYLILFPISLVSKASSRRSLKLKRGNEGTFFERNHTFTREDLENTW